MKRYEKPMVFVNDSLGEGVYAASGDKLVKECDSIYMLGVWQGQDTTSWGAGVRGYKQQFGCLGCPANTYNGCGLQNHYEESNKAESYDQDKGNRKPSWEAKGYGPDDTVTDWNQ